MFAAALGLAMTDADWLRDELLRVARQADCQAGVLTDYGQRYIIDFTATLKGKSARLRSAWIVRRGGVFPRLTTCYVL